MPRPFLGWIQCPHTAVIALKTQKNENILWKKSTNEITLRKMQKIRIQNFF